MGRRHRAPHNLATLLFVYIIRKTAANTCTFSLDDGSVMEFNEGDSIETYLPNRCSNSDYFPCYCNPKAPGQIDCPYCRVTSQSGELLCINDGDSFTYTSLQGTVQTCDCELSTAEFNSFSLDCRDASPRSLQNNNNVFTNSGSSSGSCIINGRFYNRGQILGFAHDSGCAGPSFDFQCLCNPDLPDQIECPFCYFDMLGSNEPICLHDGEIATFRDTTGNMQTCGCTVPNGGTPSSDCMLSVDQANTCVIQLPDATYQTFAAKTSLLRAKPSRCGSEYPCFCDPTVKGQIWCPYCVYPESKDSLICARDGETTTYTDFQTRERQICSCSIPTDTSQPPKSTCSSTGNGQTSPANNNGGGGTNAPTTGAWQQQVCQFGGNVYFEGENVGDNFRTRCGSPIDFPCYCNPSKNPPVDCPYCGFALQEGSLLCLKDKEVASFVNIDNDFLTCGCTAPTASSRPVQNCLHSRSEANTCVFQKNNADVYTYQAGDAVADSVLPASYCGPNFPCYCDPTSGNQLSCPFCVTVDFGGKLICAAINQTVSYKDETGNTQRCVCDVSQDLSGGGPALNCAGGPPSLNQSMATTAPSSFSSNVCSVFAPNGTTVNVTNGASFGSLVADGVCGSSQNWPAYCNATGNGSVINGQVSYPYCIFTNTSSGQPVCAKNNGRVNFMANSGATVTCTCLYDTSPITSCSPANSGGSSGRPSNSGGSSGRPSKSGGSSAAAKSKPALFLLLVGLVVVSNIFVT